MIRHGLLPLACLSLFVLYACERDTGIDLRSGPSTGSSQRTIAVIPKGTTHVFWTTVERGAKRAGRELGVKIVWKGPITEDARSEQIQVVQQFITQDVDGVVLAPLDQQALVNPVRTAGKRGIPVVIFDSALAGTPGRDYASFVATDNLLGGRMGGEKLVELMGGAGKVVLLRYQPGSASTGERETGFLQAIAQHQGVEVLVDNQYAGATMGEAKNKALNMIDQIRQADGVFCSNESTTLGMLRALESEQLMGKVRLVGFDASPPLVLALKAGRIDALVVQEPETMGYRAVEAIVKHLNGEKVDPVIKMSVVIVTRDNVDDPEVKRLLE